MEKTGFAHHGDCFSLPDSVTFEAESYSVYGDLLTLENASLETYMAASLRSHTLLNHCSPMNIIETQPMWVGPAEHLPLSIDCALTCDLGSTPKT